MQAREAPAQLGAMLRRGAAHRDAGQEGDHGRRPARDACPGDELGLAWNDPEIGVKWPTDDPLLSPKDREGKPLSRLLDRLPRYAPKP